MFKILESNEVICQQILITQNHPKSTLETYSLVLINYELINNTNTQLKKAPTETRRRYKWIDWPS